MSNTRKRPRLAFRDRGLAGPALLLCWAIGFVVLPWLLVSLSADDDVTLFSMGAFIFGPLALLLAFRGGRDDGRAPSAGFQRRSDVILAVAVSWFILAAVAVIADNPAWLVCFWFGVLALALAKSWGAFAARPEPPEPE